MRKIWLFLITLNLLCGICCAQRFLALDVYGLSRIKRIKFFPGDVIRFKMKNDKTIYKAELLSLEDSAFDIEGMHVPLKIVNQIYISKGNFLTRDMAFVLFNAGLGFILLDTFNNGVNGISPLLNRRAVIPGASLMIAGKLIRLLSKRKYKIGENRILKVIDTSP